MCNPSSEEHSDVADALAEDAREVLMAVVDEATVLEERRAIFPPNDTQPTTAQDTCPGATVAVDMHIERFNQMHQNNPNCAPYC